MKKVTTLFYKTNAGNKPVQEWLLSLDEDDRKIISKDVKITEYGLQVGMPIFQSHNQKLFEVRSNISDKRISRVIFTMIDEYMVLLHAFITKIPRTTQRDIELALDRLKSLK